MHNTYFINDYQCGKYDVFNSLDWEKHPFWDKDENFFTSQFKYINSYQAETQRPPKSFDNRLSFLRDKHKTLSSYEYLRKPKEYKNDILIYEVCVYSNADNAFGDTADLVLDKIPTKIIEAVKNNSNIFILINYSCEGYISEDCLSNINNWVKSNIPYFQFILVHANYNIFNWYNDWVTKNEIEETFTVIPYLWSFPMFINMIQHQGFSNQKLNEYYDFEEIKEYDFNCLMRRLRPLRTKMLLDFDKLNLLHKNQISYDTNQPDTSDKDFYNFIESLNPASKEAEWERFKAIRERKPKQTIDYDDLNEINGIGMETDIPYKDSMFTVVAESYFWENEYIGYISEKIWKPIIHKHPFIVFGNVNVLAHLQHWGFKTYGETGFIDESYDTEKDPYKRYVMIMEQILFLCNLTDVKKKEFMFNAAQVANFNFKHFQTFDIKNYNDTFSEYLNALVTPKVNLNLTSTLF
mgnify:CR=1 FL=1